MRSMWLYLLPMQILPQIDGVVALAKLDNSNLHKILHLADSHVEVLCDTCRAVGRAADAEVTLYDALLVLSELLPHQVVDVVQQFVAHDAVVCLALALFFIP